MARRLPFVRGSWKFSWALALLALVLLFGFSPSPVSALPEDEAEYADLDQGRGSPPELGFPGDDDQPTIRPRGRRRDFVGPGPASAPVAEIERRDAQPGAATEFASSKNPSRVLKQSFSLQVLLRNWWAMIR